MEGGDGDGRIAPRAPPALPAHRSRTPPPHGAAFPPTPPPQTHTHTRTHAGWVQATPPPPSSSARAPPPRCTTPSLPAAAPPAPPARRVPAGPSARIEVPHRPAPASSSCTPATGRPRAPRTPAANAGSAARPARAAGRPPPVSGPSRQAREMPPPPRGWRRTPLPGRMGRTCRCGCRTPLPPRAPPAERRYRGVSRGVRVGPGSRVV